MTITEFTLVTLISGLAAGNLGYATYHALKTLADFFGEGPSKSK